eukprot:TRINITY_DN24424_c0_g1_i1.p1 TRINITY_DN24424_c0_g1~~TRINITY_DN24424_c0_g1_i1.p1  ORF type:complete len:701 (+),score=194.94 TRINITY_DN24424_c0_g1_i1:78-2105(+)
MAASDQGEKSPATPPIQPIASFSFTTTLDVLSAKEGKNLSFGSQADHQLAEPWQFWLADAAAGALMHCRALGGAVTTNRTFWRLFSQLRLDDLPGHKALVITHRGMHPATAVAGSLCFAISTDGRPALNRLWFDTALALVGSQLLQGDTLRGCTCDLTTDTVTVLVAATADPATQARLAQQLVEIAPRGCVHSVRPPPSVVATVDAEEPCSPSGRTAALVQDLADIAGPRKRRGSCPGAGELHTEARPLGRAATAHGRLSGWAAQELEEDLEEKQDEGAAAHINRAFTAIGGLAAVHAPPQQYGNQQLAYTQPTVGCGDAHGHRPRGSSVRRCVSSGELDYSSENVPGYIPHAPLPHVPAQPVQWTDYQYRAPEGMQPSIWQPVQAHAQQYSAAPQGPYAAAAAQPQPEAPQAAAYYAQSAQHHFQHQHHLHHQHHFSHQQQPAPPQQAVHSPAHDAHRMAVAAIAPAAPSPSPPSPTPPQRAPGERVQQRPALPPLPPIPNPEGWDVPTMLHYLEVRQGLPPVPVDDQKHSKSRSPRNRRKIRERKIREAAAHARREMELWAPMWGAPPDAWICALSNKVMTRPAAYPEEDWFRLVKSLGMEGVCCTQLHLLDDECLARFGVDTPEKLQALRWSQQCGVFDGPQPHPLYAVAEEMRRSPITLPPRPVWSPTDDS